MLDRIIGSAVGGPIAIFLVFNAPYFAIGIILLVALIVISISSHQGKLDFEKIKQQGFGNSTASISAYLKSAALATFGFAFLRLGVYIN